MVYAPSQGSGMKVKVMESMAYGVPVVTTWEGVEGIDYQNGRECWVAETDEELAGKVCRLLENPVERQQMRDAARTLIEERYSPRPVVDKMVSVYQQVDRFLQGAAPRVFLMYLKSVLQMGSLMLHFRNGRTLVERMRAAQPCDEVVLWDGTRISHPPQRDGFVGSGAGDLARADLHGRVLSARGRRRHRRCRCQYWLVYDLRCATESQMQSDRSRTFCGELPISASQRRSSAA